MMSVECKPCGSAATVELRRRTVANSGVHLLYQCLVCGRAASTALPRSKVGNADRLPPWDESLAQRYNDRRIAKMDDERAAWFAEHDAYLKTPKWRKKRAAVLLRAQGTCEGCAEAPATQVHHLTYDHWRDELLWELVAICDSCHARIHAERKSLLIRLDAPQEKGVG